MKINIKYKNSKNKKKQMRLMKLTINSLKNKIPQTNTKS